MRRSISFLALGALLIFAAGCDRMSSPTGPELDRSQNRAGGPVTAVEASESDVIPGQYIVVLNEEVQNAPEVARALADEVGAEVRHVYRNALKGFSTNMSEQAAEQLSNRLDVAYVEQDRTMHMHSQTLPTGVDRIEADKNSVADAAPVDVDIAILDTGIDLDHPDLNVVHDVNCTNESGGPPWQREASCGSMDSGNGDDGNGHGTHVGGTAAALDNELGVIGVAPGARLWAVKVLDDNGSGSMSMIVAGVDWVTGHSGEIEVANMSLGGTGSSNALRDAIQSSVEAGIVYTVSAGNDGNDVYGEDGQLGGDDDYIPAAYPEVATISAMADSDGAPGGHGGETSYGEDDSFASFSNFSRNVVANNPVGSSGAAIDLLLPGVDILSTYTDDDYNTLSGTSMSSPHAAGLAALYIAENGLTKSDEGVYTVRQGLIDDGVEQSSEHGLAVQDDPDTNPEPIGWAEDEAEGDPPAVSWSNPNDDATVSGTVDIEIDASDPEDDNSSLTVEWRVDDNSSWNTATHSSGGTYTDIWESTEVSDGSHALEARAGDSDGNTTTATISITVDNSSSSDGTMHVGDLEGQSINNGRTWTAEVTVTIHNADHEAVKDAEVSGEWSTGGLESRITDADGKVTFSTSLRKNVGETTFTVTDVSDGLTYDSSNNHDADGDSDGTSITITKP